MVGKGLGIIGLLALGPILIYNNKKRRKVIHEKTDELEAYRIKYQEAYEQMLDEINRNKLKGRVNALIGLLLFIAGGILLYKVVLWENKIDIVLSVVALILMVVGLIKCFVLIFRDSKTIIDERNSFLEKLINCINPAYEYIPNVDNAVVKEEFEKFSQNNNNIRRKGNGYFKKADAEVKAPSFRICSFYKNDNIQKFFLMMIPVKIPIDKLENAKHSINEYLKRYETEYHYSYQVRIENQSVYLLGNDSLTNFFSYDHILKRDNWSLYQLYCAIKLATDISEMSF